MKIWETSKIGKFIRKSGAFFRKNKGITLVELLIVIAIMGLVLSVITPLFITGLRTYDKGTSMATLQQDARLFASEFRKVVQNAADISCVSENMLDATNGDILYHLEVAENTETDYAGDYVITIVKGTYSGGTFVESSRFEACNYASSVLISTRAGSNLLDVEITASDDVTDEVIDTNIGLNNISDISTITMSSAAQLDAPPYSYNLIESVQEAGVPSSCDTFWILIQ
jgi:prepilin-type N-terminal cleavage/methylation domain-containing protein